MKVLLTSDHHLQAINGVVVAVKNLYKELKKKKVDVKVLVLSPTSKNYVEGDIYHIGSIPFNIYPDVRASIVVQNPLIEELIHWQPDLIHSQCEFFTYSFTQKIAAKCKCPIVHTYHTMYEHYIQYLLPLGKWGRFVAPIMRIRLKTADVVIAPTQKTKNSLMKGKIASDIRVIPSGIELSQFDKRISPEEKKELLDSLNIPKESFVIGSVGRLAKEKNYSEVLQTFKKLLEIKNKTYLVLTGGGAYLEELKKEAHQLGIEDHVRFPGMVPMEKVYYYYQILDVFVSASISETQGLTYIEALANGLPVIARKDEAIEGVIEEGVNGLIFESQEKFLEKLLMVFDPDKKENLSQGAIASRKNFGTELFGDRVYKLYEEVLNRNGLPKLQTTSFRNQLSKHIRLRSERSDYGQFYQAIQSKLQRAKFQLQNEKNKDESIDSFEEKNY